MVSFANSVAPFLAWTFGSAAAHEVVTERERARMEGEKEGGREGGGE